MNLMTQNDDYVPINPCIMLASAQELVLAGDVEQEALPNAKKNKFKGEKNKTL